MKKPLQQYCGTLTVSTTGGEFRDITKEVTTWVVQQNVQSGLLTLFSQHTSASLLIQENADPNVIQDIKLFLSQLVPVTSCTYQHTTEGLDDMPAHIKTMLTDVHISVPVYNGRLVLGVWQGIYLLEHRRDEHERRVFLHLFG